MRPISGNCTLIIIFFIAPFFFTGCKEVAPDNSQLLSITGKWNGTGNNTTMYLDLVQNEYNVSGVGTWIMDSKTYELAIVGWCDYPNISLTLTSEGITGKISYSGKFETSDKHSGKINSPTMSDTDFQFVRQK